MQKNIIVVVGAGPAGMMAAIRSGSLGQEVILIDKNPILGKKLLLSGKGRCNLTNAGDLDSFLKGFSRNGQFLRDAFRKFFNQELMDFFQSRGLALKVERQLRVFPVTDSSSSIVGVLDKELAQQKVRSIFKSEVKDILVKDGRVKGLYLANAEFIPCAKIILATGGATYSFTGSTGEGLKMAQSSGHTIIPLRPGLVPLEIKEKYPEILEGLTLKNIRIKFCAGKNEIISEVGELLFTGFGISGPLVLALSAKIVDWLKENKDVYVEIDLKPGLSRGQLDERFLREFKTSPKKGIKKILKNLLPLKLIDLFIKTAGIDPYKKANQLTQDERRKFVLLLKSWRLAISRARPLEEGMVTQGGVTLKDINPRTMESRRVKGLYFCGEMIDVDADTGGFNLQAAFSTGYLAGESAALS
ncbi:MAG: NAD(P)/FAD-dependent oxidoreductase [Candidatus Omnitrophica bacterium]|nr:NAD(P)/FAD-dependent oxidoreductase [Candidatus Omnitrophota bacterium]MDD5518261.1 NAD(P)/FAD-dependent oxidoreductase [Candidatus Omnitrophota bacterium]